MRIVSREDSSLVGSFSISLNWGEDRRDVNCSICCWICSGEGGWDMSLGRFMPDRRDAKINAIGYK